MVYYLEKFTTILCLWDESNQFMGSFGRYSSGNSAANYDRSIYLECSNAGDDFARDLKAMRCIVLNPRISLCLLGFYLRNFKL